MIWLGPAHFDHIHFPFGPGAVIPVPGDPRDLILLPDARERITAALSGISADWAAVEWDWRERTPEERMREPYGVVVRA